MAFDAIISHPVLAHYLRYTATTVGRDQLLRTIQYFSRFYAGYLRRQTKRHAFINAVLVLHKQLSVSRQILRAGRFLDFLRPMSLSFGEKNPVLRYLGIGRQLSFAGYLFLDNIGIVDVIGARKLASAENVENVANRYWVSALIFSSLASIYKLLAPGYGPADVDIVEQKGTGVSQKPTRNRSAAAIQLISDLCDLTIPLTSLRVIALDDGLVGVAGTISSIVGVRDQWRKTA